MSDNITNPSREILSARQRGWALVVIVAVVALVVFVRIRLLQIPLERDEGEYAYAGQLMLDGVPPYKLAYNMKLPGTYAAYSAIMAVFGETTAGIHFGFLLANLAAIALLYFIAKRLAGFWAAIMACVSYALLSLSPGVLGLAGHATHLVTLAALGGILLLLRARDSGSNIGLFWSGFCFGVGFVCKQPGLYFGMFGFTVLAWDEAAARPIEWQRAIRKAAVFSTGVLLPFGLTCLIISILGTFDKFWFWTFTYAKVHAALLDWGTARIQLEDFFTKAGWVKWSLPWAAAGLLCVLLGKGGRDRKFFFTAWLAFSLLGFSAAFYFSRHYFILMLPVVSLLIAITVTTLTNTLASGPCRVLPGALFGCTCLCFIFQQRAAWFEMTPVEVCRSEYGGNPFPESVAIAKFIKENTTPDARIAVIGSEPQIYFYAHRHSATGFIYMYDLVQVHRYASEFQRETIHDIETVKPEYLVLVLVSSSWVNWPGADNTIRDWSWQYISKNYERAGVVYIYPDHFDFVKGKESLNERTDTTLLLGVYKRKDKT